MQKKINRHFTFSLLFLLFVPTPTLPDDENKALPAFTPEAFWKNQSKDSPLRRQVEFWIRSYTEIKAHQAFIHDSKYVDHIYETINTPGPQGKSGAHVQRAKDKWKQILMSIHRKQDNPERLNASEKRVFDLFHDVKEPHKFLNAAHRRRLRAQFGQKEQFFEGVKQARTILGAIEEVFKQRKVPVLLTRLPFVESSFNVQARSKVGASGIWQFMRSTAQLYITINDSVDERNDPVRSSEAAAQLLRSNFLSLGNWPLAVTAYNHGRKAVMRTSRKVGSDELEQMITDSHQRSFGFASSNFFSELLAAIEVEQNAEKYFGPI